MPEKYMFTLSFSQLSVSKCTTTEKQDLNFHFRLCLSSMKYNSMVGSKQSC